MAFSAELRSARDERVLVRDGDRFPAWPTFRPGSEQVVFGDFGIARDLPAFKTTPVEFTPQKPGEFTWTCGMNMLRGKLVVEPA